MEVILLGLASAPRPAGMAALYALLSASHPRRVLMAYVLAGFAFSVAVGVTCVAVFNGAEIHYGDTAVDEVIELVAGAAALGYAAGVASGRAQPPSREGSASTQSAMAARLRQPSVGTAAAAGVATHLPGLFYIVALNAIVAGGTGFAGDVLLVLIFNAIWFGAAIASVVFFLIRPGGARRALLRATGWARAHARGTTVAVFSGMGAYLSVKGASGLLD